MRTKSAAPKNVDEYIAGFPQDVQQRLQEVRAAIRAAAPEAEEKISYQIPAFTLRGKYLIYFAGFKKHIGMYPAPAGNAEFKKEISAYKSGKATVKFPLDRPVPLDLVRTIVKLRAKENLSTAPRR